MTKEERREEILSLLEQADAPLTGSALSSRFGVTRQVIVGDIAVLRAEGREIIATPQGYLLYKPPLTAAFRSKVAVRHGGESATLADELNCIVDLGGTVVYVSVEHPLYGEITANLQISSRLDVQRFIERMAELKGEPLLVLTDGYHLHTIEAPTGEDMERIKAGLRQAGYLVE